MKVTHEDIHIVEVALGQNEDLIFNGSECPVIEKHSESLRKLIKKMKKAKTESP